MNTTPFIRTLVGTTIAGRFEVLRELQAGGMGAVYVARQNPIGREVALKVVHPAVAHNEEIIARFEREARAVTQLQHPNIVSIYEYGHDDEGRLFLAMELLEGQTLRERLREGPVVRHESLNILLDVLAALRAAHGAGILHRDLKPENVMLVEGGGRRSFAKLLDFGLAKHTLEPQNTALTQSGVMMGTPGYMAPEAIMQGQLDDPRSDLYAVGVLWYELRTGEQPFTAPTAASLAMAHAGRPRPKPSERAPNADIDLDEERAILSMMAIAADDRPADVDHAIELVQSIVGTPISSPALEHAAFAATKPRGTPSLSSGGAIHDLPTGAASRDAVPTPHVGAAMDTLRTERPRAGRSALMIAAGVAVGVLATVGVTSALMRDADDAAPPPPTTAVASTERSAEPKVEDVPGDEPPDLGEENPDSDVEDAAAVQAEAPASAQEKVAQAAALALEKSRKRKASRAKRARASKSDDAAVESEVDAPPQDAPPNDDEEEALPRFTSRFAKSSMNAALGVAKLCRNNTHVERRQSALLVEH